MKKVVVWFSCGATSAIAAKMTLQNLSKEKYDVRVIYCDTRSEDKDNYRFMGEVGAWIGLMPEIIGSDKYHDIWDVFEKTGWLVGVGGARCTTELKKRIRQKIEKEWQPDFQVFGFEAGTKERQRASRFRSNNPEVNLITPLQEGGGFDWCQDVDKLTCLGMLEKAGIEVPITYRKGFNNANCLGCVKGGAGYWNHIRKEYPYIFDRMAKLERKMNVSILKTTENEETKKIFLDELSEDAGRHDQMKDISCDLLCGMMYEEITGEGN